MVRLRRPGSDLGSPDPARPGLRPVGTALRGFGLAWVGAPPVTALAFPSFRSWLRRQLQSGQGPRQSLNAVLAFYVLVLNTLSSIFIPDNWKSCSINTKECISCLS